MVSEQAADRAWNLRALREHIRANGPELASVLPILASVDRYVQIFRYHLYLARDAMKGVVDGEKASTTEYLKFVLHTSDRQDDFAEAKIASEANLLGCMHAARALFDVFAFTVNALVLAKPIRVDICEIARVTEALQDSPLKIELQELLASTSYRYVSAFVNTAKHRHLVQHGFWVSFQDGTASVRLGGFEYKGEAFPARTLNEALEGVLEVKNRIVTCGRYLNELVLVGDGSAVS